MSKRWRVLISKSRDIYLNLAWEDWLYRKENFTHQNMLLLWRNDPCVVIGRYQNPWKEVNVPAAQVLDVAIARRLSGGGTVYHDAGNVNFTFLTDRSLYNRRKNLEFIVELLRKEYGVPVTVNKRDDIVVDEKLKISGTAAKLGRTTAYHHCTLLVSVVKDHLRAVLSPNSKGIQTNATESLPSPTVNLTEIVPGIDCNRLIHGYARNFAALDQTSEIPLIEEVLPSDTIYPGVTQSASELRSRDFIFGKTPKFNIIREYWLPNDTFDALKLGFDILVDKGVIQEAAVTGNLPESVLLAVQGVCGRLRGLEFDSDVMWSVLSRDVGVRGSFQLEMDFAFRCLLSTVTFRD